MAVQLTCPQGHCCSGSPSGPACPVCGEPLLPVTEAATLQGPPAETAPAPSLTTFAPSLPGSSEVAPQLLGIAGFQVLQELGRGGMGVVYQALQVNLDRLVALKVVLAGAHSGEAGLARFHAEAGAVARMQHPNIVQIYEVGEHQGCPFLALEYVDGGNLADRLHSTPQPPRLAARFLVLLARAVHYAHGRGIVHRDLKPVNILLARTDAGTRPAPAGHAASAEADAVARLYGIPKVADFGLAKNLGEDLVQTQTGAVLGTPSYMAPEQAEGHVHAIGPATDVYGLGAILYEMLTARPPFRGESPLDTICKVVADDPVPPCRLVPRIPRDLETICLKCLHKDPKRRYATALDLADDLGRFLDGEPIAARPVSRRERLAKWAHHHPAGAALVLLGIVAALVVVGGGVAHDAQMRRALDKAESHAEESRQHLVRLHVDSGNHFVEAGDGFTGLAWFSEALRLDEGQAGREDMHRIRIACVLRQCPRLARLWVADGGIRAARFAPDGRSLLTAGDAGRARLRDVATGRTLMESGDHARPIARAVFSPDGSLIATASLDGTARLWEARSGKPAGVPLRHGQTVTWVSFHPSGKQVVTAGGDGGARVWDGATGRLLARLDHRGGVRQALFSPDGRRLVTAGADGTARLWPAGGGEALAVLEHRGVVYWVAFSPDGTRLVTGSDDHTARVWDIASGQPVGPPLRHERAVTLVAFSPDGTRVLTASDDHSARVWAVPGGEMLIEPLYHHSAVQYAEFSPDGCLLVTAGDDNTARVWSAASGQAVTPPLRHNGTVNRAVFSPDGRFVATASDDRTIRLWDVGPGLRGLHGSSAGEGATLSVEIGRRPRAEVGPAEPSAGPERSPDGKWMIEVTGDMARVRVARTRGEVAPPLRHRLPVNHAAFSPDGSRVVTASDDHTARVWDSATGKPVTPPLTHASGVLFAGFRRDGARVVTTGDDNAARVWDARTGQMLLPPLRHQGTVVHAAFSDDGRFVATASRDQTARAWDAATGEALTPPLYHPWAVRRVGFSSDGLRLSTTGPGQAGRQWDLRPEARPVEDLVTLAGLLAGIRIDRRQGALPLGPEDQLAACKPLRERYPESFTSTPAEVLAWHRQAAHECLRARFWSAAVWHLDRLASAQPGQWLPWAQRGLARAELERWAEAGADLARAARGAPVLEVPCLDALLRLKNGDESGYRRACAALLERQASAAHDAFLIAWACVLGADSPAGQRVVALAERAVAADPRNPDYLAVLGAALYRAGRAEAAVGRLNEAMALRGAGDSAEEWLLLALARQRLGHRAEARQLLARAVQQLDRQGVAWHQRVRLGLLRREAEMRLRGRG